MFAVVLIYLINFTPFIGNRYVAGFVFIGLFVNIVWGFLNLLPILPLDGGRIFEVMMSSKNPGIVPWVGLILAVMIAVLGLVTNKFFATIMFSLMAMENWKMIQGPRHRGY